MKKALLLALIIATVSCCSHHTTTGVQEKKDALHLSKDHFRNTVSVIDEPSETIAEINTHRGYKLKNDTFLKAFIHKETGDVSFQVHSSVTYQDSSWRDYRFARYKGNNENELLLSEVTVIDRDVYCE